MGKVRTENSAGSKTLKRAKTNAYKKSHDDNGTAKSGNKTNGTMPYIKHFHSTGLSFFGEDQIHGTSASEKISIIKNGISKKELEAVKKESDLDYDTLSNILSVSKATLHNKKGAEKFDQNTSERIMLLADVIAYGQSVFENKDSFNEWLKTTNRALGDITPVELMDTIYGIDEVRKEIGRIEYGVF